MGDFDCVPKVAVSACRPPLAVWGRTKYKGSECELELGVVAKSFLSCCPIVARGRVPGSEKKERWGMPGLHGLLLP